jgi:hypothetical protein
MRYLDEAAITEQKYTQHNNKECDSQLLQSNKICDTQYNIKGGIKHNETVC